jgi:phospholipase C
MAIDHVVALMLENRSFDNVVGKLHELPASMG